jgi:hypothetical protein
MSILMFPLPPSLDGGFEMLNFPPSKDGGNGNKSKKGTPQYMTSFGIPSIGKTHFQGQKRGFYGLRNKI